MPKNSNKRLTPEQQKRIRAYHRRNAYKSTFIIMFVIVSVFAFTGLAIWLQFSGQLELSSTLITCFYAFCTGELWMLASIKKAKIYKDVDNDGIPDEIDDYIDYSQASSEDNYNRGVEDALYKINELLNSNTEGDEEQ